MTSLEMGIMFLGMGVSYVAGVYFGSWVEKLKRKLNVKFYEVE